MELIQLVIELLVLAGVVGYLIERICRWNIYLHGVHSPRRSESADYSYTFAIQNGEDVACEAPLRVSIDVEQEDSPIKNLRLFCGPMDKYTRTGVVHKDTGGQEFFIECSELPALDTWVIRFESVAHPRHVVMRVRAHAHGGDGMRHWLPIFRQRELRLGSDAPARPPSPTPSWGIGVAAVALSAALYLFPVLNYTVEWLPLSRYFSPLESFDAVMLSLLVVTSLIVFVFSRRRPQPLVQGYLDKRTPTLSLQIDKLRRS